MRTICFLLIGAAVAAEDIKLSGLQQPVEVLRDQWGVPHIYAKTRDDLFFAQGYMAARDRLFQLDLWRRQGTGKLAEAFGPAFVERDRTALLLRYRGDWEREWPSYAPDTWHIVNAFVRGINAHIRDPKRKPSKEFQKLGLEPGLWQPNDVVSRIAAFSMMSNLLTEVQRARLVDTHGAAAIEKWLPPDPFVKIEIPRELNLKEIRTGSIAALAVAFSHALVRLCGEWLDRLGWSESPWLPRLIAIAAIGLLTAVNYAGARWGGLMQNVTTFIKVGTLVALMVLPFITGGAHVSFLSDVIPRTGGLGIVAGFATAMTAVFWAYDGWGNIGPVAEEIRQREGHALSRLDPHGRPRRHRRALRQEPQFRRAEAVGPTRGSGLGAALVDRPRERFCSDGRGQARCHAR